MTVAEYGIPVTRRIVRDFETRIKCGELTGGTRLPSVRDLAAEYEISTAVTLAAYRTLEKKGLVERRAGSGTFVAGKGENSRNTFFDWGIILPVTETEALLQKIAPDTLFSTYPEVSYTYNAQYQEWLRTRNADGESNPGFASVNDSQVSYLALKETLLPLDDLLERSGILQRENFPANLLYNLSWNGKLYALPVVSRPTMFFFNRRIFREAGLDYPTGEWSWQDLYDHTRKLTGEANGRVCRYGLAVLFVLNTYASFVYQNDGELFDHNSNCVISSDNTFEALNFFSELFMLPGCCSHHRLGESRASLAELMSNDLAAMLIGDAVDYHLLCERMPREDWGVLRLPGKLNHRSGLSIRGIGLTAGSRSEERFKLLEQLFSQEYYPEYCRQIRGIPGYDPAGHGTAAQLLDILQESSPARFCISPNASNALLDTIEVVFSHKLPLTRKQCAEFERKINARL